ncbi:uncharacterized protein LOC128239471 [Mya arenaria]|uniref:uncharacterized protein LOC128239471 n=1 Tax=Mya arenaria TaxID=6604 RepID=UPI0022E2772D|nr:uncharacterized protein LOC128239471 [Mya arenaria]
MIWLRIWAVAMMVKPTTCVVDRVGRLERQIRLLVKSLQSYVDVRIDTIEGEFGSLTDRVLKLESLVNTPDNDSVDIDSNGPRTWHTKGISYTKSELNDIKSTLTMYEHSFSKQKKEMIDVNYVVKDTLAVFLSNASSAVNSLVNTVSDHVQHSTDNISATLEKVNNTLVESGRLLRSDILTYLSNISSEGKIDMIMRFEEEKQEHNNTLFTLNSRVLHHIANETESLEIFKTNLLKDVYATRENVQNETIEMEKKVDDLIGKANDVVGNIDEQRSTIEDGIMVTIRALHSFWSDWSAWSDCSQSCDTGSRSRNRKCDVNPPLNDSICIGNETATEECVIHEYCPFDGSWSLWGSWGQCDVTCGNGTMTRDRTCDSRALDHDGDECQGDKEQTTSCVVNQCPVDGGWSEWSLWGSCSSTCGIGMERRERTCDNSLPSKDVNHCFGDSGDNRLCIDIQCPVGWTSWSDWSSCSVTCGIGQRQKSRSCQNPSASIINNKCPGNVEEIQICSSSSCTVGWTSWSAWSSCSVTCGTGLQKRSRSCQNPMTSLINDSCSGDPTQFQTCADITCVYFRFITCIYLIPFTLLLLFIIDFNSSFS